MNYPILYKKDAEDFSSLGTLIFKNAWDVFVKEVINGEYVAEFDIPLGDEAIGVMEYDDFVKIDDQLFRIRSISSERSQDSAVRIHIKCVHVWYDACDCKYIHHTYTQSNGEQVDGWIGVTPRWVMEKAFENTPFFVNDVEIDTLTDIFATKSNPAEIVSQLIENVGGELERNNYAISLRKSAGSYKGKRIVYGKNMTSIQKKMDDSAVITRLYPLGQDDMDISSVNNGVAYIDSPLANAYGYIRCGYKNYSDISDPEELMQRALAEWSDEEHDGADKPKVEYTVESCDLEGIKIGDTVRVTDEELKIDILSKVCEVISYPYEPYRGSITISNHKDATVSITEKILKETATLEKITDKNGNIMSQYIDNVREKLQSCVDDETAKRLTVHEFGDIWVDNLACPSKAMVITDALFAVANSHKENGDWDWRTIGTADNFIADNINASWLNAGYINTDKITIRSSDGGASLTGNCFTITTPEGFEATMSADEGFKYVYRRDSHGNPYDYITLDHNGQKRYWHGHLIPSTYQFAKGTVECTKTSTRLIYGAIELKGAAWLEIARLYNKIIDDDSLTDLQKSELINTMIRCSVTPTRITSNMTEAGAVVLENEIVTQEIGTYSVPKIIEIYSTGTEVDLRGEEKDFYYDGAMMLYYGTGGYIRENGGKNSCYSLEAVYDIAVTLDIGYE